jgi:hypothetical protein
MTVRIMSIAFLLLPMVEDVPCDVCPPPWQLIGPEADQVVGPSACPRKCETQEERGRDNDRDGERERERDRQRGRDGERDRGKRGKPEDPTPQAAQELNLGPDMSTGYP